jgi:hypothetical protein
MITRVLSILCVSLFAATASAQVLVGAGFMEQPRGKHTLYALRVGYALDFKIPVILGVEYARGSRSYGEGFPGSQEFYGGILGLKIASWLGAELSVCASQVSFYNYGAPDSWSAGEMLVTFSVLLFTHKVSHFYVGGDFDEYFKLGYAIQLHGY